MMHNQAIKRFKPAKTLPQAKPQNLKTFFQTLGKVLVGIPGFQYTTSLVMFIEKTRTTKRSPQTK
jgi:hypothetical protein